MALGPLKNDPIMSGRLIRMFKHLKHQNLSTDDDFIHTRQIIVLVPFLFTKEALTLLTNYPIIWGR